MRSTTVLFLQAFAAATAVAQEQEYTRCYTPITGNPPPELNTEITQDEVEKRSLFGGFEIDTYVHVITTEAKEGMYPRSMVEEQVSQPLSISFLFFSFPFREENKTKVNSGPNP